MTNDKMPDGKDPLHPLNAFSTICAWADVGNPAEIDLNTLYNIVRPFLVKGISVHTYNPETHVVVPKEPTGFMICEGMANFSLQQSASLSMSQAYAAMINAAKEGE